MKTNQTDKAKFVKFVSSGACGQSCCSKPALFAFEEKGNEFHQCQEHTPLDVRFQAIKEHAALVAVAEAAEHEVQPAPRLTQALANLAAVRGESEGGK